MPNCGNCKFFRPNPEAPDKDGECRKASPTLVYQQGKTHRALWPVVYTYDWCGDWCGTTTEEAAPPKE